MLDSSCIQNINLFQKQEIRNFVFDSNSWSDFSLNINNLGSAPQNNKKKGDTFELISSLYLINNPIFSSKLSNLWHHSNVPKKIFDSLDLKKPEIGVDLIAESNDGKLWAIQCKYHEDIKNSVSYDEVSTFFSITERKVTFDRLNHRLICSSALDVSKKIPSAHKDKLGFITYYDFSQLAKEDFDSFRSILQNEKIILSKSIPRDHQRNALDKCLEHFAVESRGKLIHPCGSGKSLTGYWFFRYMQSNNVLIVVPSLQLVRQTLKTWSRELLCEGIDIDWIAICSDEDVKTIDDPALRIADIGIEVNTDINSIANFLQESSNKIKLVITTYQSGNALIDAAKKVKAKFDIGIFDEAHKTVGNKKKLFAKLLDDDNIFISKRLFMTATERVFRGDSDEIVSMDNEQIYGQVVDQFSFKAALEQKPPILTDYRIVSTSIKQSEIRDLIDSNVFIRADKKSWSYEADASTFASLITLRKMIKKHGIKHVISFHSSIKRAEEFKELNDQINQLEGNDSQVYSFHIKGKDGTGVRTDIINRFTYYEPSLITNARCLTEGVDIPQVDAVLFADPKQSKVDIVQAAGRAMRIYPNKAFGYIIVPVVLDGEDENTIEENLFKQIITVVSAMGMNDDRIIAEFQQIAQGKKNNSSRILDFDFDVEDVIGSINLKEFYTNIELKIWDRLSFARSFIDKDTFASWMKSETNLSEKSIKNYVGGVNKITNDILKMKPEYSSLDELMRHEDLSILKNEWLSIPENKELDKRGNSMYTAGFNKLIDYAKYEYFSDV